MQSIIIVIFLIQIITNHPSNGVVNDDSNIEVFGELRPELNALDQEDPRLINILRDEYLEKPPSGDVPYNLAFPSESFPIEYLRGQYNQPVIVNNILKNKKNGFFVEAGAADGQMYSNSLLFELLHQWKGLLVEPNPEFYETLSYRNRRAYRIPQCLSTKTTPEIVSFDASGLIGGIVVPDRIKPGDIDRNGNEERPYYRRRTIRVQCFPFYSILSAIGNPRVDYFSLDIEGAEMPVLKTIPWDKVDIGIIDVEVNHLGAVFNGTVDDLTAFMDSVGYKHIDTASIDYLFRKKSEINKKKKRKSKKIQGRSSDEL